MGLFPVRADHAFPTLGHILGLLSSQFLGAIIVSGLLDVVPNIGGVGASSLASVLTATLYALVSENQVPGSVSGKRYRIYLALMVSGVLSLLGVAPVLVFNRSNMDNPVPLSSIAVTGMLSFVLYSLYIWIGLRIAAAAMTWRRKRAESKV